MNGALFVDRVVIDLSTAKQGDNVLGSVRPSVCPPLTVEPLDLRP